MIRLALTLIISLHTYTVCRAPAHSPCPYRETITMAVYMYAVLGAQAAAVRRDYAARYLYLSVARSLAIRNEDARQWAEAHPATVLHLLQLAYARNSTHPRP